MYTCRPLNLSDKDAVVELYKIRPTIFNGYTDDQVKKDIFDNLDTYLSDKQYYVPALFKNDILYGFLIAKESQHSPSWTWGHWISHPKIMTDLCNTDGVTIFREAEQMLFEEMEVKRKLNKFYILYSLEKTKNFDNVKSVIDGHDRRFKFTAGSRIANYTFFTECIIEANTMPKYDYQKAISMNRTWPFTTVIRMGVKSV